MKQKISNDTDYQTIFRRFQECEIITDLTKTMEDYCFAKTFSLTKPQHFVGEFLNPSNNVKSLLCYHEIGSGKTLTQQVCAEHFLDAGWSVYVAIPKQLISGFEAQAREDIPSVFGNKYLKKKERDKLRKNPTSAESKEIIAKSNARINARYKIYTHKKFVKYLNSNKDDLGAFKNSLIIIDELHDLISEIGNSYKIIHDKMTKMPQSTRLMLLTASPIFDKPSELALIINLLNWYDSDLQIATGISFEKRFIKQDTFVNIDELIPYLKGKVSYFRGAPPYTFPTSTTTELRLPMSILQAASYKKALLTADPDLSLSFHSGCRKLSNVVFPNGKVNEIGFKMLQEHDFHPKAFAKYSPKIAEIYKDMLAYDESAYIYTTYKNYSGVKTIAAFLEHQGFVNIANEDPNERSIKKKRFALWTGDLKSDDREMILNVFNNKNNEFGEYLRIIIGSTAMKQGVNLRRASKCYFFNAVWNSESINQPVGRMNRMCSHRDVPKSRQKTICYLLVSVFPTDNGESINEQTVEEKMYLGIKRKKGIADQFLYFLKEVAVDRDLNRQGNYFGKEGDNKILLKMRRVIDDYLDSEEASNDSDSDNDSNDEEGGDSESKESEEDEFI